MDISVKSFITEKISELIELLGNYPEVEIDERLWDMLRIYMPKDIIKERLIDRVEAYGKVDARRIQTIFKLEQKLKNYEKHI